MKNLLLVQELPDVIKKNSLLDEIRAVIKELTDTTVDAYVNAKGIFDFHRFQDPVFKRIQILFQTTSGTKGFIVDEISDKINTIVSNLSDFQDYVQTQCPDSIIKDDISTQVINMLQLAGVAGFFSMYSRKLLMLYYTQASSIASSSSPKYTEVYSKAEIAWITENINNFAYVFDALKDPQMVLKIKQTPKLYFNQNNISELSALQSNTKIDPLRLQHLNVTNNFIFRLMLKIVEFQANRYKLAVEEKRLLEHRHLLLMRQMQGGGDALLEREIGVIENRIAKLTYYIRQIEEENA